MGNQEVVQAPDLYQASMVFPYEVPLPLYSNPGFYRTSQSSPNERELFTISQLRDNIEFPTLNI
jgi:hypothetical protein